MKSVMTASITVVMFIGSRQEYYKRYPIGYSIISQPPI
jgi:hypothetical protein